MSDEVFTVHSHERVPIRTRESGVTHSAWRMQIASGSIGGTITLIDFTGGAAFYRGAGLCLGWTQEQLAETYQRLIAPDDERPFEVMQLG
jgi:hypothetical protein